MASALADHRVAESLFNTPPPARSRVDPGVLKQQKIHTVDIFNEVKELRYL